MIRCQTLSRLILIMLSGAPIIAQADALGVAAAPMHAQAALPTYPRLTVFPDAKVRDQINTQLAAQEKTDRDQRRDCLAQLKDANQPVTRDSYGEDIAVTYLTRRFLSISVLSSYDCGGPYPTNGAQSPLTFDLTTGTTVDWTKAFKPGFMPSADHPGGPPSVLTRLYRARYRKAKDDADCVSAITDDDPFAEAPILWLDSRRGLIFQPDFSHVIAACADEMALSGADLAPYLKDAALLADLNATVKPATGRRWPGYAFPSAQSRIRWWEMAMGGPVWASDSLPLTRSSACWRVNRRTSSNSVMSGVASPCATSAIRPSISCEGNGQGWQE
jgi:hypothetical protein